MAGRFAGKVLFATGAGSGLARETARRYTSDGGRVAVTDVSAAAAEAAAAELEGSIAIECDVTDESAVARAVARTRDELGRIDHIFNAAGIADFGPLEEWSLERFNRMLAIHVGGTFLVCKHGAPVVRSGGGGAIVNVASIAALTAQPFNAPYGAAKAAVVGYSRQLALELAPDIRVNVVAPGRIRTAMTEPLYAARGGGDLEAGIRQAGEHVVLGRVGRPEEIAGPACFLFSDDASFMTGQTITPDGGETIL